VSKHVSTGAQLTSTSKWPYVPLQSRDDVAYLRSGGQRDGHHLQAQLPWETHAKGDGSDWV
jgi:hypothetical protein